MYDVRTVDVPRRPVAALEDVVGLPRITRLLGAATDFRNLSGGRVIWNVSSTDSGGGGVGVLVCVHAPRGGGVGGPCAGGGGGGVGRSHRGGGEKGGGGRAGWVSPPPLLPGGGFFFSPRHSYLPAMVPASQAWIIQP